jgi:hypothetical protein
MTFSEFVTDVYGRIGNRATGTLALLRQIVVDQLKECAAKRVAFMQGDQEFTLLAAAPYNGQWAGPEVAGFPKDVSEIHKAYYRYGGTVDRWEPLTGPVPFEQIESFEHQVLLPTPLAVYPLAWSWWGGKFWVTRLGGDTDLRIQYYRDATRDQATGVEITSSSTTHTNPWFERGVNYLRWAVLLDFYSSPEYTDERQIGICGAQRNLALQQLEKENQLLQPASAQAPMVMGGSEIYPWR